MAGARIAVLPLTPGRVVLRVRGDDGAMIYELTREQAIAIRNEMTRALDFVFDLETVEDFKTL